MSKKRYNFFTILQELNKQYNSSYKISNINTAELTYNKQSDTFGSVFYTTSFSFDTEISSIKCFVYHYITTALPGSTASCIRSFIRSKEKTTTKLKIKILPSSKIRYAYLCTNSFSGKGSLGNSCMRHKGNQKSLNFYIKNNVKVVVAIDDNSKIHARALLWDGVKSTQAKNSFTYLDRVYTKSDSLLPLFYDLAKENDWKSYGSSSAEKAKGYYYIDSICTNNIYYFPYTDTFRYLFYKDNLITSGTPDSIMKKIKHKDYKIQLTVTSGGGYFQELDPNSVKESLTNHYISKKNAVFVKRYNGWVSKDNIADINGNYYSTHDNKIVKSPLDRYILKENSVNEVLTNVIIDKTKATHLSKYNGYIHKTNIVCINDVMYHKQDTDIINFGDKWYHISQCFINYNREKWGVELATKQYHFWIDNEVFVPHPKNICTCTGGLIPKERAIIAYNIVCVGMPAKNLADSHAKGNPKFDKDKFLKSCGKDNLIYQEVYLSNKCQRTNYIILNTGIYIINSFANKQYLKKFNNKWYIKQDFEAPNKKQLEFAFVR